MFYKLNLYFSGQEFIDDDTKRTKKECPHIGEWLMLLAGSAKYRYILLVKLFR